MKRRMTQGLSVVLSTAMVLSGSGIGTLSASASAKEDSGVESSVDNEKVEETQENQNEPEKGSPDAADEEKQDTEDKESQDTADGEKQDAADEGTDAETSSNDSENEEETNEKETNNEETQPEETDKNDNNDAAGSENEDADNEQAAEDENKPEESKEDTKQDDTTIDEDVEEEKKEEDVTQKPENTNAKTTMWAAALEEDTETSAQKFLSFLEASTPNTYTITTETELIDANVSPTVNKITTIEPDIILTINNTTITSRSRFGFDSKENNEATINVTGTSCLQGGRFEIGGFNGGGTENTKKTVHMTLKDSSSITATTGFLISTPSDLTVTDSAKVLVNADKYLTVSGTLTGSGNGTIFLEEGAKVTVPDGTLNDQGHAFSSATEVIVVAENTAPANNQLTAGNYTWNGTCFCKSNPEEDTETSAQAFLAFLQGTDATTYTITTETELDGADVSPTANKITTVEPDIILTINNTAITSKSRLGFDSKENNEATINITGTSCLQGGRFEIGGFNGGGTENTKKTVHMTLEGSSSITATTGFLISTLSDLTVTDSAKVLVNAGKYLTVSGTLTGSGNGTIFLEEGAKVTVPDDTLNDQGHAFSSTTEVTVAAENTAPADNQLTAGNYTWNGTCFYKSEVPEEDKETSAQAFLAFLQDTDTSKTTYTITAKTELTDAEASPVAHKITTVSSDAALTIANTAITSKSRLGFISEDNKESTIRITGTSCLQSGKFEIGGFNGAGAENTKKTVHMTLEGSSSITATVGLLISTPSDLTVMDSAKVLVNAGKTLTVNGRLIGSDNGSITLGAGAKVTVPNGTFNDQGHPFSSATEVTVASATTASADNQLTAGTYTWNGTCFYKSEISEPIPDSGITNEADLIAALLSDSKDTILITESFKLSTPVTLTSNHVIEVAEGKTLTITGQLATGKARLTFIGKGKVLARLKGELNGRIYVGLENQKTPKGGYLVLNDEAKISGGNPYLCSGAKLEVNSPEGISLAKGNTFTIEEGGLLSGTGGIKLAEGAKVVGTSGKFSDQGTAFSVNDEVVVAAANTEPADNQLTAGTYTWNGTCFFKPVPAPLPATELKDGVLILSNESANRGSDQGWAWDAEKNVLNVNYRFKDMKQIQFVKSEPASIKLNADITLTPDEGIPAIITGGNFIFRADDPYTLTVSGPIKSEGRIEFINKITLNLSGTSNDDALLQAEGDVMIKGNSTVIVNNQGTGPAVAGNNVTIKEEAELNATGKGREAVIKANGAFGIGGPSATVTAVNRGKGLSMNKSPNISDYPDAQISASEDASGRPGVDYIAENIQSYRYVKIKKAVPLNENPTVAEIENAVEHLEANDYDAIDTVIGYIHNLDETEKAALKSETLRTLDSLLQKATGIKPKVDLSDTADTPHNQQILKAEIFGALIAAGLDTNDTRSNTSLEFVVEQLAAEDGAAATFTCSLYVNGNETGLKLPVTLKVELPPEYFPLGADQMLLRGIRRPAMKLFTRASVADNSVVERWLDFVYDGKDNSATFQTDLLGTFSLIRKVGVNKPGSSGGSGGGGGSSTSGISRSTSSGASTAGPGTSGGSWILDNFGWWYQYADQSYPTDGWFELDYAGNKDWYLFNQNGYMITGWALVDGKWYYLNPVSDGTQGRMLTGWQQINGKWYYLNENSDGTKGVMLTDTWIGDYYVNSDGVWEEGKKK